MRAVSLFLLYFALQCISQLCSAANFNHVPQETKFEAQDLLKNQPVNFIENKGQFNGQDKLIDSKIEYGIDNL